jgi:hypothetical protein
MHHSLAAITVCGVICLSAADPAVAGQGASVPEAKGGASSVGDRIYAAWSPDCTPGARDVTVRVNFQLDANGNLVGEPKALAFGNPTDPAVKRASEGAVAAISRAAPFSDLRLPAEFYGKIITVQLNSSQVCAARKR